jgi:preprotein translocase subunit SecF
MARLLFANADYKFIEKRKTAYIVSGLLMAIGVAAMIFNQVSIGSPLDYGVDFTGGTLVEVRFANATEAAAVRDAVTNESAVTQFGGENVYVIRTPQAEGDVTAVSRQMEGELGAAFGAGNFEVVRTEVVGPTIGEELQRTAIVATLLSFLLTLVYLAFRFETRFGLAAVLATFHDVMLTLGFIAVARVEVQLPTIAAILTIVGYSINDKIVVFDRIRENLHKKGARKEDQIGLINRSINETLPRTVMTGMSVLATLLSLLFFGPPSLRGFSAVLFLGTVIGTYSSIFIGSAALVEIRNRWGEGKTKEKKARPQPATV